MAGESCTAGRDKARSRGESPLIALLILWGLGGSGVTTARAGAAASSGGEERGVLFSIKAA